MKTREENQMTQSVLLSYLWSKLLKKKKENRENIKKAKCANEIHEKLKIKTH